MVERQCSKASGLAEKNTPMRFLAVVLVMCSGSFPFPRIVHTDALKGQLLFPFKPFSTRGDR